MQRQGLPEDINATQRHNHCFGTGLLAGNKRSLVRRHNAMRDMFGSKDWSHLPETFDLPDDYHELMERMAASAAGRGAPPEMWILKPTLGARGEGIELISTPEQVPQQGDNTIQRYIADPYLVDGRKIHLRLYVAITELEPLRVLMFGDGLVLFANTLYSQDPASFSNKQVHLTNAAVAKPKPMKNKEKYQAKLAAQEQREAAYDNGGDSAKSHLAWSLGPFLELLSSEGHDVEANSSLSHTPVAVDGRLSGCAGYHISQELVLPPHRRFSAECARPSSEQSSLRRYECRPASGAVPTGFTGGDHTPPSLGRADGLDDLRWSVGRRRTSCHFARRARA
jgi:hypothetical protein